MIRPTWKGRARQQLRIEQDGNRAADVINRLRSFYKKGTPSEREMVDVKDIIREMTALLRTEAVRHSVTIHSELDADMPNILADRVQLQQVFMNLMLNAIEAMKDTGGELTIRVATESRRSADRFDQRYRRRIAGGK